MTDSEPDFEPPRLTVRSPIELIEAVPFLLGFHPRESLVLVGVDTAGPSTRIGVVARVDLSDVARPGVQEPDPLDPDLLVRTVRAVARPQCRGLLAVAFRDSAAEPDPALAAVVSDATDLVGVDLLDLLVAGPDSWICALGAADPTHGTAGGARRRTPSTTAVAATVAGLVALPDRDEVVRLLAPYNERDHLLGALDAATRRTAEGGERQRQRRRRSDVRALFGASRALPVLSEAQLVRFGAALSDPDTRDACWLAMEDGRIDGEGLWRELGRRLPSPYDAPALFLVGWAHWRQGNGTLAGIAAEQALASDPQLSAADLLMTAVAHGLDPFRTPKLRRGA